MHVVDGLLNYICYKLFLCFFATAALHDNSHTAGVNCQ